MKNTVVKLYKDRDWLTYQYHHLKRTPDDIAHQCHTSAMTIYRYIKKFGL